MKKKPDLQLTAKQVAFADIAAECKKQKEGQNYVIFENEICESLGIQKPDFRKLNGGRKKMPLRIYVTFHTDDGRDFAIQCGSEDQVDECICELMARTDVKNVRTNRCGEIKNKKVIKVTFGEFEKQ